MKHPPPPSLLPQLLQRTLHQLAGEELEGIANLELELLAGREVEATELTLKDLLGFLLLALHAGYCYLGDLLLAAHHTGQ